MSFIENEHIGDGLALLPVVHAAITTAAPACHGYVQIAGIPAPHLFESERKRALDLNKINPIDAG